MLIHLNDNWTFCREDDPQNRQQVRIPHTNIVTPFNYFSQRDYQFVSIYEKTFDADPSWQGKVVLMTFMAVAHVADVYVNGQHVLNHKSGYTAFRADIAGFLDYSAPNLVRVVVDSRYSANVPPFGGMIDYMTYGGIYREVFLDIREQTWLADIFVHGDRHRKMTVQTTLAGPAADCRIRCILSRDGVVCHDSESESTTLETLVENAMLWDIDDPVLYRLTVELLRDGRRLDIQQVRFGFRTCGFTDRGFFLNGRKIKIIGLNRHQSYPYAGYAMPARVQRRDAEILKNELKVNAVRTSHYPQSQHFIDACDELGLLVLTEIPGWQHIGDKAWQDIARENVREMVTQYRNHPSIILWGVRINESQDCDELYRDTNQIARTLDPTRQTNGVRYIRHSHLLEDVYTFNDFTYAGQPPVLQHKKAVTRAEGKPYLITEFNGHMYPTKSFDPEAQRQEHALRHAAVLNGLYADDEIAGGLGWCMCDYNTNKDFGSGDHICYHGVMDMFRNPKLAAAVYAANSDDGTVLVSGSYLNKGEYPQALPGEICVFTNAESIRLYRDDQMIREYPANNGKYPHLPHPPVLIDDFIGNALETQGGLSPKNASRVKSIIASVTQTGLNKIKPTNYLKLAQVMLTGHLSAKKLIGLITRYMMSWGAESLTYRLEAIRDGKPAAAVSIGEMTACRLEVDADTTDLAEGGTYDVASVRIRTVDAYGNTLPLFMEPVELSCEGNIELIGASLISLKGGCGGTYVRTTGLPGEGRLSVHTPGLESVMITFKVTRTLED